MCDVLTGIEEIRSFATSTWAILWNGLNSSFGTAATGSFFGAVGGYVLVIASSRRAEILAKIDRIKVAIAITHTLFNISYSMQKQHLFGLFLRYEQDKAKFITAKKRPTTQNVVEVLFDNRTISLPYVDFNLLNSKLLSETGFSGRAFVLASTLIRCLHDLQQQLEYRHSVFNQINSAGTQLNAHDKACLYYGINMETATGSMMYQNYSDVMAATKGFTEDCIWFSKELSLELLELAKIEAQKISYKRPNIGAVDYSDVDSEYMPNDANYNDWRTKFKKA